MRPIAETTGGRFFEAPTASDLAQIYQNLGSKIGTTPEEQEVTQWFAAAGLLLVLGGAGLAAHVVQPVPLIAIGPSSPRDGATDRAGGDARSVGLDHPADGSAAVAHDQPRLEQGHLGVVRLRGAAPMRLSDRPIDLLDGEGTRVA